MTGALCDIACAYAPAGFGEFRDEKLKWSYFQKGLNLLQYD